MSQQLQITGGAKVRDLNDVIIGTSGVLSSLAFNVANGVPKLDVNGKILVSQLPNSVMEYQGTWNASTNTPTLVNGVGNQGDVYLCNVAGTTNFGAGPITFAVGDSAIYSGTIWQRAGGATGTVTSVGLSTSGNAFTIGSSPVTTSGTITINGSGTSGQYINGAGNLTTFPTLISSIGLSMPSAFSVSNSPLTANGTIAVTGAGYPSQYIRGDGTLADFPSSGGGGSSVSYYLNGETSQGTIGGITYYEMSKTAVTGTGVDFPKSGDGLIVSFLTDAGDPAQLNIPAGNWNYEIYASMSSNGGTPQMYAELYVYNGTTFTLIATSSNEILYDGVNLNLYTFAMTVPATTLALTDRLAVKLYATNSGGKTTTVHTQDSHLCQIITTFSTGITALNGLTAQVQYFATGTSGSDFNISSSTATHTFNIPDASATARGLITTSSQILAGAKTFNNGINLRAGYYPVPTAGDTGLASSGSGLSILLKSGATVYTNNLQFSNASNDYTFPNATGTIALLENAQTFSGAKTFSGFASFTSTSGTNTQYGIYLSKGSTPTAFSTTTVNIYSDVTTNNLVIRDNSSTANLVFNNSTQTYTFPAASGTIALTSSLASYVPYTGATGNVDLGAYSITGGIGTFTNGVLNGNGTNPANLYLKKGSSPFFSNSANYGIIAAVSSSFILISDVDGTNYKYASFNLSSLTNNTNRAYTLPDASGTLALTSDLVSYVTLATTQTITGQKSFSGGVLINSGSILLQNGVNATTTGYTGFGVSTSGTTDGFRLYFGNGNNSGFNFNNASNYTYTLPATTGTLALTSDLGSYLPLTGGTLTGQLYINPTNTATVGLDVASDTVRFRSDNLEGFKRQLEITMGSGTLVQMVAKGYGANYITDMAFYTATTSGVNGSPAIYITGTNNRVGIKTGTPSYDLDVSGSLRNTTSAYFSTTSGSVGIGTTTTDKKLSVKDSTAVQALFFGYTNLGSLVDNESGEIQLGSNNTYAGRIAFSSAGSTTLSIDSTYNGNASVIQFRTKTNATAVTAMTILGSGNVGIGPSGTANTAVLLSLAGQDSTSSNYLINGYNLAGTTLFAVRNDGVIFTGTAARSPVNDLNGAAANLIVVAGGNLQKSTASSGRYKENITDWSGNGLETILALKPKTFTYKESYYKYSEVVMLGLIAEEVAEVSPYLADYENQDRTGLVENVRYANIVVPLIKAIQEMNTKLDEQNQTIQSLQEQINILAK